jgi:hypothetical protein
MHTSHYYTLQGWVRRQDWGHAHQAVARCFEDFLDRWDGLHACATAARRQLLRNLHIATELEDYLQCTDALAAGTVYAGTAATASASGSASAAGSAASSASASSSAARSSQARGLLQLWSKWSQQLPSQALDPPATWNVLLGHRSVCINRLEVSTFNTQCWIQLD